MENIINRFQDSIGEENVKVHEPMKNHTTFRVGGPASYYLCPHTVKEIQEILKICREEQLDWFILGNGSNLLVSDEGYDGVIIQMFKGLGSIETDGTKVRAQSGALLSQIAVRALKEGLGGFEFAAGIPGTLGGAVMMNAGAYGGEMKQVLEEVTVLDCEGKVQVLRAEELHMGYRTSIVKEKNYIVLEAVIGLEPKNQEEIGVLMEDLKKRRSDKQPLEYPSAGSTFKRPEGYFAGKLIMDTGLRGYCVGGACISEKHCGFVINKENATASDVYGLMQDVRQKVHESFGVWLEPEVKMLGRF